MEYSREVFDLQLRFARRLADLTTIPFDQAVFDYTAFYLMFGIPGEFDRENPAWIRYVVGLAHAADNAEWTHHYYRLLLKELAEANDEAAESCFSFAYHQGDRRIIRLHFANRDGSGSGPLSSVRQPERMHELAAMFEQIRSTTPEAQIVRGESWLYNRIEYTRLFPPKFGQSVQAVPPGYQYRALWGQFVRSDGGLQTQLASAFSQKLADLSDLHNLGKCFPFQVLRAVAEIGAFYTFYGLQ